MPGGMRRSVPVILLAATAAVSLAACASGVSSPQNPQPGATGPAAQPSVTAGLTPQQRADADVKAILASFAVPPGAMKLTAPPASTGETLANPAQTSVTPDIVDVHSFWEVPGNPATTLAWVGAHLPREFQRTVTISGKIGSVADLGDVFSLSQITGVLNQREMLVEVAGAGHGQTAIRVDAQDTWIPAKSPDAVVPAAAAVVTASMNYGMNADGRKPPAPVTITDPATVAKVAALINGQPPFPPGTYSCPMDDGMAFILTFRAHQAGPVLATATLALDGCGATGLEVGKQSYGLGDLDSARPLATQILKVTGLPWKLPPFEWPAR
jgi:hypothetical protein